MGKGAIMEVIERMQPKMIITKVSPHRISASLYDSFYYSLYRSRYYSVLTYIGFSLSFLIVVCVHFL